jgi:hypothetical protein
MSLTTPDLSQASIQLGALEDKVQRLSARIEDLEQHRLPSPLIELDRLIDLQMNVQSFTENLFGSTVSLQPWLDEETDERHFIVYATATGEVEDLVRLNHSWHERIGNIAGDLALKFRLSLSFA